MKLTFKKANNASDIEEIYQHNSDAFTDSPDFKWTLEEINNEVAEGWELYSLVVNNEIVAALFFKVEGQALLTKNTAIKSDHQGAGLSHTIKEFFEKKARELKLKQIYHYCRIDNFRMYSLNESHSYKKTPSKHGHQDLVVEWVKQIED